MNVGQRKKAKSRKEQEAQIIREYEKAQQRKERAVCRNCQGVAVWFCAECGKVHAPPPLMHCCFKTAEELLPLDSVLRQLQRSGPPDGNVPASQASDGATHKG